ncbi:hypothetical protein [Vibrio hepatarius]|uniref:hypothetical protein n=1 Tax=Vibrio hepatarius TaxID=171383 RepID=UPI001C0996D6|nr:hypothetical protein [Vibrio hepatarius]MBU2898346.1 hypothetical protein [Vibrio hepatarius]
MFFKVAESAKSGDTLIGSFSVQGKSARSYKALRCLSVPMEDVNAVLHKVILEGKDKVEAKDVMFLKLKEKQASRGSLEVLKKGAREAVGWVPSVQILHEMGHEFQQFLFFVNELKDKLVADLTKDNGAALFSSVNENLSVILNSDVKLSSKDNKKLSDSLSLIA